MQIQNICPPFGFTTRVLQSVRFAWFLFASVGSAFAGDTKDFFVLLTTGKSTKGVATEDIEQKQRLHIENFGRLAKLGSLTAAGPCADPSKIVRGIVVIQAKDGEEGRKFFEPDPYVSEGFMKTEMHEYRPLAGRFQLVETVTSMEESVIVVIGRGNRWKNEKQHEQLVVEELSTLMEDQFAKKKLGFGAHFVEPPETETPKVGVMIFLGKEVEEVTAILDSLSIVKDEIVSYQAFAQYLAKGALGNH